MSINELTSQYNQLQADITELDLPKIHNAYLTISTQFLNVEQLTAIIEAFSATQGWVQYSDKVVISTQTPSKPNILEAQYCNDKKESLHIKHHKCGSYLVNTLCTKESAAHEQFYTEQALIVRNNLKEQASTANYRIWWQLESEGVNEGRWLPLAQQFLGFSTLNNKEVK